MDIESHINLRSFEKPTLRTGSKPIIKAIGVALLIHSLLFIYWNSTKKISVAEIPKWINVKLIAGFEEKENIIPSNEVKEAQNESEKIKKESNIKTVKKNTMKNSSENNFVKKINTTSLPAGSSTTFIKADSRPYTLDNPKPVYPAAARRRGMQGVVLLSVEVNRKGYVDKVGVLKSSGYKILDISAINCVEKWKFIPAQQGNKVVTSVVQVPVRFILNEDHD